MKQRRGATHLAPKKYHCRPCKKSDLKKSGGIKQISKRPRFSLQIRPARRYGTNKWNHVSRAAQNGWPILDNQTTSRQRTLALSLPRVRRQAE